MLDFDDTFPPYQTPQSAFDPERVDVLVVPDGKLYPWQKNTRPAICQKCRATAVPPGGAIRFIASRNSSIQSNGYFCTDCVTRILAATDWHWNPFTEELYPQQPFTQRPVSGADLSAAFRSEGERGLFRVLVERHKP